MENNKIIVKIGIVGSLLIISTLIFAGCAEPDNGNGDQDSFKLVKWTYRNDEHDVQIGNPPNGIFEGAWEYNYKAVVCFKFNRPVDENSFKAPGSVNIIIDSSSDSPVTNVEGWFKTSQDKKTIVFVSDENLNDLLVIDGGDQVDYTIYLLGNDAGAGVLKDSNILFHITALAS